MEEDLNSVVGNHNKYQKRAFDSSLTPESLLVSLNSSADVPSSVSSIVKLINEYGVVVVEFAENESAKDQLLCFKSFLGEVMYHDRSDSDGIAEVAATDEHSPYPGVSSRAYTFHTDGSYDEVPPKIVALRCEISAQEGGITQLASGKMIHDWLRAQDEVALQALYRNDALAIKRAGKAFSGPIFKNYSRDSIGIRYRTDEAASTANDPDVQRGFNLIEKFLSQEENLVCFKLAEKQVLITDNITVLHARTAFGTNDPRRMQRLWFNGESPHEIELHLGFTAN